MRLIPGARPVEHKETLAHTDTLMANPYQRAIFVLREISKIQSHIVPIRIFKMHKIIVD